jgi:hypothetical protein
MAVMKPGRLRPIVKEAQDPRETPDCSSGSALAIIAIAVFESGELADLRETTGIEITEQLVQEHKSEIVRADVGPGAGAEAKRMGCKEGAETEPV